MIATIHYLGHLRKIYEEINEQMSTVFKTEADIGLLEYTQDITRMTTDHQNTNAVAMQEYRTG